MEIDLEKMAYLARLELSQEEMPNCTQRLNAMVDLAKELSQVDTTGVVPMAHPLDATQRLRDDVVTEKNLREHFLKNAPASEAGLYLVPQVIEG